MTNPARLISIHPDNPEQKKIDEVVQCLNKGGIIIFPTDTVYGIGCNLYNSKAIEKVARIKGVKVNKSNFSLICHDLSDISDYSKPVDNSTFKLMRQTLPGPYTYILKASSKVPKIFNNNKKTIGIRIPGNNIAREIVKTLGNPIITTSVHDDDTIIEYTTDPELIFEKYQHHVDMVINGGFGRNEASTVIDCTGAAPEVVREGIGLIE